MGSWSSYGNPVFKTIVVAFNAREGNKESAMTVTREQFHINMIQLPKEILCSVAQFNVASLIQARFASFRFLSDAWAGSGMGSPTSKGKAMWRSENIQVAERGTVRSEYASFDATYLWATRKLKAGVALFDAYRETTLFK